MLARYSMIRGAPGSSLPRGARQDTRKHTKHILRPTKEMVEALLAHASEEKAWQAYAKAYRALIDARFAEDRRPFVALAFMKEHYPDLDVRMPEARA